MPDSSAAVFRTTRWSLVLRAGGRGPELDELLRLYWRPVYAFIRRKGRSRDEASDLTQAFVCDVVLSRDLLGRADRGKGRFRSYLLSALSRFLVDDHRARTGAARAPRSGLVSLDAPMLSGAVLDAAEPSPAEDPAHAFDRQWATTVIALALARFERRCREEGLDDQHTAFMLRVVNPAMKGARGPSLESLARELGFGGWSKAGSTVQTAKRRFRREVERVVMETIDDPRDLADELRAVRDALRS